MRPAAAAALAAALTVPVAGCSSTPALGHAPPYAVTSSRLPPTAAAECIARRFDDYQRLGQRGSGEVRRGEVPGERMAILRMGIDGTPYASVDLRPLGTGSRATSRVLHADAAHEDVRVALREAVSACS